MRTDKHITHNNETLPEDPTLRETCINLDELGRKLDAMLRHGEKMRMKAIAREAINEIRAERRSFWR